MKQNEIWVIELTDASGKKSWRRYLVMDVSGINNKFPKLSLELCKDFINAVEKFHRNNVGGIVFKARIVSSIEMNDYVPDILYGKVIMMNPLGFIFDEILLMYLRYDLEIKFSLIPPYFGLESASIGNIFSNICDKSNIPKTDDQGRKNIKAMNDFKCDFPGGFFPIVRIIR